ncbi:hypothetical protein VPHF86_0262 [Vibrio phage F86]
MAKKKKKQVNKPRDFVAKHMNTFCHSTVEEDRKKKEKRGQSRKEKHKGKIYGD